MCNAFALTCRALTLFGWPSSLLSRCLFGTSASSFYGSCLCNCARMCNTFAQTCRALTLFGCPSSLLSRCLSGTSASSCFGSCPCNCARMCNTPCADLLRSAATRQIEFHDFPTNLPPSTSRCLESCLCKSNPTFHFSRMTTLHRRWGA
jgi:hypothetical protein